MEKNAVFENSIFSFFFNFKCDSKDRKTIILNIPLFSIDHG